MSEKHRALGYCPPPGSLAATAQSASAKHPDASSNVDPATLVQAAVRDAHRIEAGRGIGSARRASESTTSSAASTRAVRGSDLSPESDSGPAPVEEVSFMTVTSLEARRPRSEDD